MSEYAPSRVLVTGGAGFIGSNVLEYLVTRYPSCRFVCLDKLNYCSTPRNLQAIATRPNFEFVKGDITSLDLVMYLMQSQVIDTIMHFAAQSHVDSSFGQAIQFTTDNVMGTHVLLEACRMLGTQVRRFIHVSSDEVYGESTLGVDTVGKLEADALEPTNPYAATKAAAEYIVKAYHTSFNVPIIISRGNNVFGPRQYPEKIIPKFLQLLQKGQQCPIHGDGSNLRSYVYVDDVCRAFDLILRLGKVGQVYNIGTDFELSNLSVFEAIVSKLGIPREEWSSRMRFVENRAFNDVRYRIDSSKMSELGWKQEISFDEGLQRTIEWYMEPQNHNWFTEKDTDALK